jgi:hypothetical protein
MRRRNQGDPMTVQELIMVLEQHRPTDEVHISYDHWGTTVAPKVRRVEMLPVLESDPMPRVIDDEDRRYDIAKVVVVLRGA